MSLDADICMAASWLGDASVALSPWRQIMRGTGCPSAPAHAIGVTGVWRQGATVPASQPEGFVPVFSMRKAQHFQSLHAADGSLFSPSGAVDPALTIAAQAVLVGDRLTSILIHQEPVQ
ncbi:MULTISPECIES: hypothetical protein [unclassified Mesorhizobium]|uniref:hypothetical protein n=1 Tax=unclassified Mesorhizobium TaxID=325217 RepID=UPI000FDB72DD|nr:MULTISPECIES: hypothetical protein [unclassified Mesorhizobium]TGQ04819.1 hypothetical protein EN862_031495 [Mesorhizobium sp. M2E.F.Ca.ET.219.01.1.1]TGT65471.1 hypothetical protein EN809_032005 [Mesorhizobium sp. M2E.F.Ca.ET.166.01.1.1]TGV97517.1 hypothetical protein EN797_032015 [Mesorhizobium sp. M2E.F.Ca.ET.154.01.1.1]